MEMIEVPAKRLRAEIIAAYVWKAGYDGVVCFSCGNASRALKEMGLDVLDVSPSGDLEAKRWWTPEEIRRVWPNRFDATSGHLPCFLMVELSKALHRFLGDTLEDGKTCGVPTGSGETIVCLRWAFPGMCFVPIYGDNLATRREENAPLNWAVDQS